MAQQQNAAQLCIMLQICTECTLWCAGGRGKDIRVVDIWLKQLGILFKKHSGMCGIFGYCLQIAICRSENQHYCYSLLLKLLLWYARACVSDHNQSFRSIQSQ